MKIGGVRPCSLIDYPGRPAVVIFTTGCTFRCWYCHNPQLVLPEHLNHSIAENELWTFLQRRRAVLDAVVITGGEPTLHRDLPMYIADIRRLGYRVKLDTNGNNPAMLEKLLATASVDYVSMDVKAPVERYTDITGVPVDTNAILCSIQLIRESGVPHTFRLTYAPGAGFPFEPAAVQQLIGPNEPLCIQPFRRPPDGSPLLSDLINRNQPAGTTTAYRSLSHLQRSRRWTADDLLLNTFRGSEMVLHMPSQQAASTQLSTADSLVSGNNTGSRNELLRTTE